MTIQDSFDYEETVMSLIIQAGSAKSLCFDALASTKKGEFDEAEKLMEQANDAFRAAHQVQTELIGRDQGEGKIPVHLVMVHAQDHLMTSMLAKDLIEELIALYKKVN